MKVLSQYLRRKFFNKTENGIMVEVGAAGPHHLSQSKPFRDLGWRCICVEPNPEFIKLHKDIGNEIYEFACSNIDCDNVDFYISSSVDMESFSSLEIQDDIIINSGYSSKSSLSFEKIQVNIRKLDTILEIAKVSKIDFLIVDVEGWELTVLEGFSTSLFQPKVIVLECVGDSLLQNKYHEYMESIGYKFDSFDNTTGPNLVYTIK